MFFLNYQTFSVVLAYTLIIFLRNIYLDVFESSNVFMFLPSTSHKKIPD